MKTIRITLASGDRIIVTLAHIVSIAPSGEHTMEVKLSNSDSLEVTDAMAREISDALENS